MTSTTSLFVVCLLIVASLYTHLSGASSPAEPAFQSQLRSCFEPNRNTHCYQNQAVWSSCGHSIFSSYQHAVSTSLNCMRSVCGNQNGLCCNTYCSMFGLSGGDHSNCFNQCFNPHHHGAAAAATAATLSKTTLSKFNIPFDDNSDYIAPPSKSIDKTVVKCSVPCDAAYAFYVANAKPARKEKDIFKNLLSNNGRRTAAAAASVLSFGKIKNAIAKKGTTLNSGIKSITERIQVFDIPLKEVVPLHPVLESSLVGSNQICSNTNHTVEVTYYKRSRVNCRKINNWMSGVKEISPDNLLLVYKYMMIVHNKCRALIPKKSKQCVVPMFERININTNVLKR